MISTKRIVKKSINKIKRTLQEEKLKRYTRYFIKTLAFLLILGLAPAVCSYTNGGIVVYRMVDAVATITFRMITKNF